MASDPVEQVVRSILGSASPSEKETAELMQLLIRAINSKNQARVKLIVAEALERNSGFLSQSDEDGYGPIHHAASSGNAEAVQLLLDAGVSPLQRCSYEVYENYTPLHFAAMNGQADALRTLLGRRDGTASLLEKAFDQAQMDDGRNPLHLAANAGAAACVQLLMRLNSDKEVLVDVNARDMHGLTPLALAANFGSVACVKLLIGDLERRAKESNDSEEDSEEESEEEASDEESQEESEEVSEVREEQTSGRGRLRKASARPPSATAALNIRDVRGNIPLHHAFKIDSQKLFHYNLPLSMENYECAYYLVMAGSNIYWENNDGKASLDIPSEIFEDFMELVYQNRQLFAASKLGLRALMTQEKRKLRSIGLPVETQRELNCILEEFNEEMQETEASQQGGCPIFGNMVTQKPRRLRRKNMPKSSSESAPSAQRNEVQSSENETSVSSANTTPIPPHAMDKNGDISQCPFFNPALKKQKEAERETAQPSAQSEGTIVPSDGQSADSPEKGVCPYHVVRDAVLHQIQPAVFIPNLAWFAAGMLCCYALMNVSRHR